MAAPQGPAQSVRYFPRALGREPTADTSLGDGARFAAFALILAACSAAGATEITQADLLRRLIDLDRLYASPPADERTGMFSSYDRGVRDAAQPRIWNWSANDDAGHFLRTEDGWRVMGEVEGPGALTRIWCPNPHGEIRLEIDDQPALLMPLADLFSGKRAPFEPPFAYAHPDSGTGNCYIPLGFSTRCRLLWRETRVSTATTRPASSGAESACQPLQYQVNYVRFAAGTRVAPFTGDLNGSAAMAFAEIGGIYTNGFTTAQLDHGGKILPIAIEESIPDGGVLRESIQGGGVVRALFVALTDRVNPPGLYALRKLVLRVYFDGAPEPGVEAPLIDFFGSGFDLVRFNGLLLGTDRMEPIPLPDRRAGEDRYLYCFFPMPFAEGCRIEIQNVSGETIGLMLYARVALGGTPPGSLRFFARYRQENPCERALFPILETTGRGRLVGCVLNVDCPRRTWWGDGDEHIWINGERFPSYFGTGSADLFGGWTAAHRFTAPLHGITRSAEYGKASGYRVFVPDDAPFRRGLRFEIENVVGTGRRDTTIAAVAYWYGEPTAQHLFRALRAVDLEVPPLRIPDAIEIEGRVRGDAAVSVVEQKHQRGVELSGERAVSIPANQEILIEIPSLTRREVDLQLRVHPRKPFGTIEVKSHEGDCFGSIAYDRRLSGVYDVGPWTLTPGANRVTVRADAAAVLDCWIAVPR